MNARQIINISILAMLCLACIFFSFYDIIHEQILWSLGIYVPCFFLFGFGLYAWWRTVVVTSSLPRHFTADKNDTDSCTEDAEKKSVTRMMTIFAYILVFLSLSLMVYAIYLCIKREWLWGPLTFGFGFATANLASNTMTEVKKSLEI